VINRPTQNADNSGPAPRHENNWATLISLLPYLWPAGRNDLKVRVAISIVLLVFAKLVTLWVPFLFKQSIDALSSPQGQAVAVPFVLIIAYGIARSMMQGLAQIRDGIFAKVGQHALRSVALVTFRHMHALSLRFHLERRTGGLSRVIDRGTKGVDFLLRFTLFNIAPTILEIVLIQWVMIQYFNIWFAVANMVMIVVYVTFTFSITEWRTRFYRDMLEQDTQANTKAIDSLLNFETVKYFGNEDHEAERFDRSMKRYEFAAVKSQTSLAFLNFGQATIIAAGLVAVMLLGAQGIADGTMTIGDYVMINAFLVQLYVPLNLLGMVYREVKQSLLDMERMFSLLDVPAEIRDAPDATDLSIATGEVRFENVHFGYDPTREILKGVSFTVPGGKTVAIVGPSGAGKSTISRLLYRFYDVTSGRILIDGQDVRAVRQKSLRAAIGMVPQDTVLFNDTIAYNIRYGRPGADDAQVEQAADMAQVGKFIKSLPEGFQAMVGERGLKLSGGEKQRVAIARTILKNPPILLLDEATSALDSHTERDIQDALREVSRNRTTLVIAHRLSTVVDADEILVLEAGQIVERGRHHDLIGAGGAYAALWNRQQEAAAAREKLRQMQEIDEASTAIAGAAQ
jgi:ATP-binding cassette subfamily B protein